MSYFDEEIVFNISKNHWGKLSGNCFYHTKYTEKGTLKTELPLENILKVSHELGQNGIDIDFKFYNSEENNYEETYIIPNFHTSEKSERFLNKIIRVFKSIGYSNNTHLIKSMRAVIVLADIHFFTKWISNNLEKMLTVTEGSVTAILYFIADKVGFIPSIAITIILVLICFIWLIKRSSNPPSYNKTS